MVVVLEPAKESLKQLLDLSGKRAVITGGAMGIGYGIARRLAEAGATITVADMNPEAAYTSANKCLTRAGWRSTSPATCAPPRMSSTWSSRL